MPKERWKAVEGYPNYEVSSMGNVRNVVTGKLLKPVDDGFGYKRIMLEGKWKRIHVLVATAFCNKSACATEVNHKRGNKADNRASQLEWVSHSDNVKHAWQTGLRV